MCSSLVFTSKGEIIAENIQTGKSYIEIVRKIRIELLIW